jgi:nitrogen fixation protein FixH
MKFNWGHGIFTFYVFFVATLVFVVIKSRTFDNDLVTEEYYARDINYQQEFDRRQNSDALSDPLRLVETAGGYDLQFPASGAGKVAGTLHLYRPSTKNDDRRLPLRVDGDGVMSLPLAGMNPGRYAAIVEWSAGGVAYYDELDLDVKR